MHYRFCAIPHNSKISAEIRLKSYVKSEMKRHLVAKMGICICLRYGYRKWLFSVLSSNRFDTFRQMHLYIWWV